VHLSYRYGMIEKAVADTLLALGSMIGLVTKAYAVYDSDTTWPRRSSLTNVITYPFTGVIPFFLLDLYFTLAVSVLRYLLRVAIYVWRAPEGEDWLGRKKHL